MPKLMRADGDEDDNGGYVVDDDSGSAEVDSTLS